MTYITRSADHHYTFDGMTYPGVTGILRVLDKSDALMAWAARMTAEAAVDMGPALTQLITSVGRDGTVKALTSRSAWKNEQAKDLGSLVHDIADKWIRGENPEVPAGAEKRIRNYADWWNASGWRLRASEAMLVNPVLGYGGTLDLLCYDKDGQTVLADIKSGRIDYRGKVYDSIILQLGAYSDATWMEPADGRLYAMPTVHRHVVIHVTDDGVREVEVHVGADERLAFRSCIQLTNWRESLKGKRL